MISPYAPEGTYEVEAPNGEILASGNLLSGDEHEIQGLESAHNATRYFYPAEGIQLPDGDGIAINQSGVSNHG